MAGKYGAMWKLTDIYDAIMSSRYEIRYNKDLLFGLVEFWCPETSTFVFPWGEATVTLEDVMILGGFSTLGESVRGPLEGKLVKIEEEINKKRLIVSRKKSRKASHNCWIKHFMEEEREYEHVAFLSLWLSKCVFPSPPEKIVSKQVFPVAIHLSSKTRMALAPAVLASLYKNLTLLKNQAMSSREDMTASGSLTRAKHSNEEIVLDGKSESPLGAQSPLSSSNEIETLAKMEANMIPGEVNIEISVKDQKDAISENISEGEYIGCTLAVDDPALSVGGGQNMSTFIADKDVKRTKAEVKQDAEVTRNESSIVESKGAVADESKSKPGLKDAEEGSSTHDLPTLGLELEARICRLEKLFAELKEKRFRNTLENHFKGGSSEP